MTIRNYITALLVALLPATALASGGTLRGSPASMSRQHDIALQEELTFLKTPGAVLAEVSAGTLTALEGNENYEIAAVSFAYAIPEVRLLVERLSAQYREACGERLVVTSLTRPKARQPRNAHVLSVHPAGMAVDLRISDKAACRDWLESTLLALEAEQVLDVTRERRPPHYHVAVFPTPYREYVDHVDAMKAALEAEAAAAEPAPAVQHAAVVAPVVEDGEPTADTVLNALWFVSVMVAAVAAVRISRS